MSRFHRNKYKNINLTPINVNVAVAKVNCGSLTRLWQIIDLLATIRIFSALNLVQQLFDHSVTEFVHSFIKYMPFCHFHAGALACMKKAWFHLRMS